MAESHLRYCRLISTFETVAVSRSNFVDMCLLLTITNKLLKVKVYSILSFLRYWYGTQAIPYIPVVGRFIVPK